MIEPNKSSTENKNNILTTDHDMQDKKSHQESSKQEHSIVAPPTHHYSAESQLSMMSIMKTENYYKQGIIAYEEGIHRYVMEIEKLKNQINSQAKNNEKEKQALLVIESQITSEEKLLERLNEQFSQKVKSIEELKIEYRDMIDGAEYNKLLSRKKKELFEVLDEIEELEMTLLGKELERVNLLGKLEPRQRIIEEIEADLRELELEKEHFESTKLHQIPQLDTKQNNPDDVVDTVIMENHTAN